jgi:D-amino-acid oxidase
MSLQRRLVGRIVQTIYRPADVLRGITHTRLAYGRRMRTVVVIGAGVIGLTSAIRLLEAGAATTIVTADAPPTTTSYAAGASWGPHFVPITAATTEWGLRTLAVHRDLADVPGSGVRIGTGVEASVDATIGVPAWAAPLDGVETHRPPGFTSGWRHRTPLVDMPTHLAYLWQRFLDQGGTIERQRIASFDEIDAPVIVNCAGLGARDLADDDDLTPVRGQVVVCENPGLTEFFVADLPGPDLTYFFPHGDIVVLGGQSIVGEWSREIDLEAAASTLDRCAAIEPRLRNARVLGHRVGLRPYRPAGVRLATEDRDGGLIIHNYGHGGAGVTLSWGCADQVALTLSERSL